MNVVSETAEHWVRDPDDDTPRLECGVFGVWNMEDASAVVALGLHALQHRGQEACGMASFDGQRFATERHMGHVGDAFGKGDLTLRLTGYAAIGHTRYATAGGHAIRNVQPMFADLDGGGIAIAHNGNLTNFLTLRRQLVSEGSIFQSTSDFEVILHLDRPEPEDAGGGPLHQRPARDRGRLRAGGADQHPPDRRARPAGHPAAGAGRDRRPPPRRGEAVAEVRAVSETCALEMVGARFVRDVEPGEVVVISDSGVESLRPFPAARARPVPVRVRLLLAPRLGGERQERLRREEAHGRAPRRGDGRGGRRRGAGPGLGRARRAGLRARLGHPLRAGHYPRPLCRAAPSSSRRRASGSSACA